MLNNTKVAMTSANWKRIVVGGLIMSSKVTDLCRYRVVRVPFRTKP